MKFLRLLAAASLVSAAVSSHALPVSTEVVIGATNTPESFQTVRFNVSLAGTFVFDAQGATTLGAGYNGDPLIYLFRDDGSLDLADFIAADDDGSGTLDSRLTQALGTGAYLMRITECCSTTNQAVAGIEDSIGEAGSKIRLTISSRDGNASIAGNTVPEPASLALAGMALVGLAGLRRRKGA